MEISISNINMNTSTACHTWLNNHATCWRMVLGPAVTEKVRRVSIPLAPSLPEAAKEDNDGCQDHSTTYCTSNNDGNATNIQKEQICWPFKHK